MARTAPRELLLFRGIAGALFLSLFAFACPGGLGTEHRSDAGGMNGAEDAGGGQCSNPAPQNHRAAAVACSMSRPPTDAGLMIGHGQPGECMSDADCADGGVNGRCVLSTALSSYVCSYDECFTDADCSDGGGVCACRDSLNFGANTCLPAGCQVDSDCGKCEYCSPVTGGCSPYLGVVGYYCHTPKDECLNDSDCQRSTGGLYCVFDPKNAYWVCAPADCTG